MGAGSRGVEYKNRRHRLDGRSHGRRNRRRGARTYNPNSTEAFFKQQKLATFKARGYTLYAFGTGSGANDLFFFFIDSNTAAFGHRAVLEKMIEVRFGGEEGLLRNDRLYPLINEANGSGVVWRC